jgi:hypothetical protein
VVLESLGSEGDYTPNNFGFAGNQKNGLKEVWPVVGILFELPN